MPTFYGVNEGKDESGSTDGGITNPQVPLRVPCLTLASKCCYGELYDYAYANCYCKQQVFLHCIA